MRYFQIICKKKRYLISHFNISRPCHFPYPTRCGRVRSDTCRNPAEDWRAWAKFFASLRESSENGTKKPSAEPGNRVPRVKVLNYLKKVALFFRFERDILADGAQVIGRDAEKRGEVLQGKVMHDAGTTT